MRRKLGLGWMVVVAATLFACSDSHETDGDDESEESLPSPAVNGSDAGITGRLDAGTGSSGGSLDATASGPTPPPGAGDAMAGPSGMGPRDRDGGKGEPPKGDGAMPMPPKHDGGMGMMPDGGMPKPPKDDGGMPKPPKDDGGMPKPPKDDGMPDAGAPDAA